MRPKSTYVEIVCKPLPAALRSHKARPAPLSIEHGEDRRCPSRLASAFGLKAAVAPSGAVTCCDVSKTSKFDTSQRAELRLRLLAGERREQWALKRGQVQPG